MYEYDFHKHHGIVMSKDHYMKRGLSGLVNQGNTCFLNSIIQCLSNTIKLTDYFLSGEAKRQCRDRGAEGQLVSSYINLLNNIWESNQILRPRSFLGFLAKLKPKYARLEQQDSHECLMFILDLLHKGIAYSVDIDIKGTVKTKTDQLMKKSLEQFKRFYLDDFSFIVETFNGMFRVNIQCKHCDFEDDIFEPFNCLSLDLADNLLESFQLNFGKVEDVDTYVCEKCKNQGIKKTTTLWTVPDHLIVHLKRFKVVPRPSKIDTHMDFPLEDIDLTPFVCKDRSDPNNYIYSCYSINYHTGDMDTGHYYSSAKNMNGDWHMFNDSNVTKVTESHLLTKNAYILFLSRTKIEPK